MGAASAVSTLSPPFTKNKQLNDELDDWNWGKSTSTLPSQSKLSMAAPTSLVDFLISDICPTKLNQLAHHLWLCSTPSYTNYPPLHNHAVHARSIIPTEDPALHLVWLRGRIFIKPLPTYLMSHTFWTHLLLQDGKDSDRKRIAQSALGLLRTYHLMIRHASDLTIAQQHSPSLLPSDITWRQWCDFSASFHDIENDQVAPRYHYGKLQLSRLHWLTRLCLQEMSYYYIDSSYGESLTRYYGPLLFIFGVLSVLLSAMQVGLAVEQLQSQDWKAFWKVCRWFSVASLLVLASICSLLLAVFLAKSLDEFIWAVRAQYKARPRPKMEMDRACSRAWISLWEKESVEYMLPSQSTSYLSISRRKLLVDAHTLLRQW